MYKKSMFNYLLDDGNQLKLYNSLNGDNSLLIIRGEQYENAKQIFSNDVIEDTSDELVNRLIRYGYFIPDDIQEDVLIEQNLNDVVNNPKLHLVIMPTEDCNFRCVYCYENHKKGKMTFETQEAIVKFVRHNIKNYTGLNVGWFGGEPLEALDVIKYLSEEFIKICKVARKPYRAGITTNAYNLSADVYRELYRLHVYEYQISIDGLKEEHDSLRKLKDGGGSFDKIVGNIRAIKDITDIKASDIVIRTNFTKTIASRLPEYVEFYENLLGGDPRFSIQINMASDWGGDDVKSISNDLFDVKDYIEVFNRLKTLSKSINFSFHLQELNPGEFKCYAGKRNAYCIGSDAKLYKCTESFDMPENNIGVLLPSGKMQINSYYESLWVNAARISKLDKCKKCSYSGCCLFSPCPRNTIENRGKYPICPRTKTNVKNIVDILDDSHFTIIE